LHSNLSTTTRYGGISRWLRRHCATSPADSSPRLAAGHRRIRSQSPPHSSRAQRLVRHKPQPLRLRAAASPSDVTAFPEVRHKPQPLRLTNAVLSPARSPHPSPPIACTLPARSPYPRRPQARMPPAEVPCTSSYWAARRPRRLRNWQQPGPFETIASVYDRWAIQGFRDRTTFRGDSA